ncbi:MAG: hypothetical protein Q8876_06775 [Bacillota bacterium]|nr:hypothetical protein [Bacillota bacterium]
MKKRILGCFLALFLMISLFTCTITASGAESGIIAPQLGSSASYLPVLFILMFLSVVGIILILLSRSRRS